MPEYDISLPEEVSKTEWETEREGVQNHRIRLVAASLRAIDGILESDYAFLHCSPERLQETWSTLVEVVASLRTEIRNALAVQSRIAKLETARSRAADSLVILDLDLLSRIDKYPVDLPEEHQPEVRRLLCSIVGQLHAFLGHTMSALLDADPRGMGANDYSLSRRFPRHVHEAEWLHYSVGRLHDYLVDLDTYRARQVKALDSATSDRSMVPVGAAWGNLLAFLEEVLETLVPQLKDVRAMEGIRYDEMQVLDEYLMSLPAACHTVIELQGVGRTLVERESKEAEAALIADLQSLLAKRLSYQVSRIDGALDDLSAFVGIWRAGISHRRALQFRETT